MPPRDHRRDLDLTAADAGWADVLRRVDLDDRDAVRLWMAWDLCSMVEGCFGGVADGRTMTPHERRAWLTRLGTSYQPGNLRTSRFDTPYWIVDGGEPVGTLAVWQSTLGAQTVFLSSLYVEPARRGQGLATRALDGAYEAAVAQGLAGVRLEAFWTWQKSVAFYLRRRWWVKDWKRDVGLWRRRDLPAYDVRFRGDDAWMDIAGRPWGHARRDGDRLVLDAPTDCVVDELEATATFSVHLAVAGWPLVRSEKAWDERFYSTDVGQPEGLAMKIGRFEKLAREDGWDVETPMIPGMDGREEA